MSFKKIFPVFYSQHSSFFQYGKMKIANDLYAQVHLKSEPLTVYLKSLSILMISSYLLMMQSCVQNPSNIRRASLSNASINNGQKATSKLPNFSEGNNFIQNGGVIYSSAVTFDLNFSDTLQLRGKDVDNYIRNMGTQTISCLTARFTATIINQINIVAALPHSVYNFTTQTLEYYYSISPSDENTNKNFCQTPALTNKLLEFYPGLTPTYKISNLCLSSACVNSSFTSLPLELYSISGSPLTQILTKQLTYNISNNPNINAPVGQTCITNSECAGRGFDCCNLGQCVKDLALKPGVVQTSPDYIQALQDILNAPNHIYLYPQYYFICSLGTTLPSDPATPGSPVNDAAKRLKNLENLFNCTNKIEGELGICTKTISNAQIGVDYSTAVDDRSFSSTYTNSMTSSYTPTAKEDLLSIQEVIYGEVTLFNYDQITNEAIVHPDTFIVSPYLSIIGHHNDDLDSGAKINITTKPINAINSDLVIKYKTDASCILLNTSLAKCEKYYIQGQQKSGDNDIQKRRGQVTDHFPASNIFKLPYYADIRKIITVSVDGIPMREGFDWQLNAVSPAVIEFLSATGGLKVSDTQKVKIIYFVDLTTNHVMDSQIVALQQIKDNCHCADLNCGLRPVANSAGKIIDYACIYPDPNPVLPPASQTIYLSSKTVPVRYFDSTGVSKITITGDTLAQEGKAFSYRKDNLLNPNNMPDIITPVVGENTYVGFNEIYGSLTYTSNSAKAAKEVPVARGKIYDIYVDNGTYSNCLQCGNDYYSQLNRLFPLAQFGGGIVPLQSTTSRIQSNGVRADDLSFGRACLVPATMLPWTHALYSDPQIQRLSRMKAQHFLYANGYQRDWYGFDYGAVIGSFDGVKWFAIGKNRRIKADSTKLFIAINSPFGDLALESTYTVTINDGALNPIGTNMISSDLESDGAECQKFHQCSNDNDCATTLGWDYACSSVNDMTTSWPNFDGNAKEIPDSMRPENRLTSILGLSSVGKRCVYRGRGSACSQNLNINSTFNQSTSQAQHVCSSNNFCQMININNVPSSKFNNRISRYGKNRVDATSDSFGLGAKVPGRPMEFNGIEQINADSLKNLSANKITAVCIPGRSPLENTFQNQNIVIPVTASIYNGDKIAGIGMTYPKNEVTFRPTYLASCAITDDSNNFFHMKDLQTSSNAANNILIINSGTQAISTNALYKFKDIFENIKKIKFPLFANNVDKINSQVFTENRCLRAPGASCFSDIECAPSKAISDKIKMLNADDTALTTSVLNKYEVKFWQEDLVCSQLTAKTDPAYSTYNNRCCREVGKTISIASKDSSIPILNNAVPGIDVLMKDQFRYSRVATVYKDQKSNPSNFPPLEVAVKDECGVLGTNCKDLLLLNLEKQFLTFSAYAERTSCTGDWIRNFDNGDHIWRPDRFQVFDPATFRCMNWLPGNTNWSCVGMEENDPNCRLIQTTPTSSKAKGVMNYLARLELTGIPQIILESEDFFNTESEGDLSCRSFPNDQNACYPGHPTPGICTYASVGPQTRDSTRYAYPSQLLATTSTKEYKNFILDKEYFSAVDENNFQKMKKIFKSDEVASCLAAGTTVTVGADPSLCCTGFINGKSNKCQLPDFVDVSIYTNRYVSSEAKKLNINLFDKNGYIIDPTFAARLACEKNMCASGVLVLGVLISNLKTPGQESIEQKNYRFLESSNASDNANGLLDIFKLGIKLNTHAYCFPAGINSGSNGDLRIMTCSN